ncbi:MAG: polymerase, partial [Patescibacteria group bacterium]|nr:polymerase [Patescibacteria group bacterium]
SKGHRAKTDEDLKAQINQSKDFCRALNIPICELEGFEADDMLGTIAENYKDKYNIAIVSGDMDTLQLIDENVKVFTLKKGSDISIFGEKEVEEKYELLPEQIPDYKGLLGDPSDNIQGVSGVGQKTAVKILKEFKTIENLYNNIKNNEEEVLKVVKGKVYESIKNSEEEAFFSKTLATIRRDAPIDFGIFGDFQKDFGFHIDEVEYEKLCNLYELHSLRKVFQNSSDSLASYLAEPLNIDLPQEEITEKELRKLQVMSLLLESEYINPSFEKIKEVNNIKEGKNPKEVEEILLEELKNNSLLDYYKSFEEPLFDILEDMHEAGILVDQKELEKQKDKIIKIIKDLEQNIYKLAGQEFLISSPKQLGDILYDKLSLGSKIKKTTTGQRSTGVEMLESIRSEHDIVPEIIKWREVSKVYNTYIEPLHNYINEDGRVRPRFLQAGASTGRFSCENPNMQNLPRNSELGQAFRKVFVAGENKVFISADYSQIDLRSAAILSMDKNLINIFKSSSDIHRGVAAEVLNKKSEDITDEERRKAKAINFGILYGMGVNALKDAMNTDRATAQEFFDNFKNTFTGLMLYLDEVKKEATEKGYTVTLFGRRRNIPLLKSKIPFMRAQGERIAINAPIQGTSSDIIRLGMIECYNTLKQDIEQNKIKIILQIHDELVFECDTSKQDEYATIIKKCMEKVFQKVGLKSEVELIVNETFGKSLYEL